MIGYEDLVCRCDKRTAHHAIRVLEKAERAFLNGTNQANGVSKSDYLFGLTEALELHDVYLAFRDHPPQQLCERLTLMPLLSRFEPRTISMPVSQGRTPSVVVHPSPQCAQTVATCFISQGRVL